MKKLLVLLLSATTVFSLVACGKNASATSEVSNTTNETVAEKPDETEIKLPTTEEPQPNNEDESEVQEPEVAPSTLEVATSVNWEDYLDDNTWNLTAYAEALGYEWLPDPEYQGIAMYKIVHSDGNYFVCYYSGVLFVFYGGNDGDCWYTTSIETIRGDEYPIKVVSDGQEELNVFDESIKDRIAPVFAYVAGNNVDLTLLPNSSYTLVHCAGKAQYFDNGLIRQRDFGEAVERINCNN